MGRNSNNRDVQRGKKNTYTIRFYTGHGRGGGGERRRKGGKDDGVEEEEDGIKRKGKDE